MPLIDKYLKGIDFNLKFSGGFLYLNPNIQDIPLKSVKQLQFNSLYPQLIVEISKLDYNFNNDQKTQVEIDKFIKTWNYFQDNKLDIRSNDPEKYVSIKTEINRFYGKISKTTPQYPQIISAYLNNYYRDLLKVNGQKILYIDTDTIFFIDEIDLLEFDISHDIMDVEYILFLENKRYIMKKTEIQTRGGGKNFQEAIDVLKRFIRDDKIKELGL
jgi:hypothetical protein